MIQTETFDKLKEQLKIMFQFDQNELDFGIFKVLRMKREQVNYFIETELGQIVDEALKEVANKDGLYKKQAFTAFVEENGNKKWLEDIALNESKIRRVIEEENPSNKAELLAVLESGNTENAKASLANKVYSYLLDFFSLYYRDGDFGYNSRSLARFRVDYPTYNFDEAYKGEDVMFHWKHRGSYYIKSGNSFNSVSFVMQDGEKQVKVRYELAGNDSKGLAQNNNKDTQEKQYALQEIVQGEGEIWRIIFQLSGNSTPKAEIFQQMAQTIFGISAKECTPYLLADKDKKSLFNDLGKDHDKVQGGQVSGVGKLRITKDKYLEKLLSQAVFKKLATNNDARLDVLRHDPKAQIFHTLDQKLNLFFVGNDSDYFIHKDLKGFLTQEKDRFIKNIVFSSLDALLNAELNNETLSIAKAFHVVAERMIEMLHTIETFQKGLFEMKKWVLGTHYLISLGKINEVLTDETERTTVWNTILANTAQLTDWENTFGVKIANSMDLESINSLPLDTAHFDEAFTWRILAHFDDLEAATDGVLLNSENFQALNLLQERYRQRIKCIYIDPPYNTNGSDLVYKNFFRHSSWLSMIDDRLQLGRELLRDDGILCVTIDDFEGHRLRLLLTDIFGNDNELGFVSIKNNPSGRSTTQGFSIAHEYAFYMSRTNQAQIGRLDRTQKQIDRYDEEDEDGSKFEWVNFRKHGATRSESPKMYFPFFVKEESFRIPKMRWDDIKREWIIEEEPHEDEKVVYPIDDNGQDRRWKWAYDTCLIKQEDLKVGKDRNKELAMYCKSKMNNSGVLPLTIWDKKEYSATTHGTNLLKDIIGKLQAFSFPKSIYAVQDSLLVANTNQNDTILDFFAGSGTTGHAVMKLNREDGGRRKFVLVEMGQYFDVVLKERIRRVMFSMNWKDGKPVKEKTEGYIGLVKYQKLAQYEDVLNNLETLTQTEDTPSKLPAGSHTLHYLYRPEVNVLHSSLDLSKPFGQTMLCGKDQTPFTLDLLETYCYLKGFSITKVQTYTLEDKTYQIISSGNRLVIFRDIEIGENDTKALKHILNDFPDATMLYVNHHAELLHLQDVNVSIEIIHADEFITGTTWE